MAWAFTKMQGLGNDFVVIESFTQTFHPEAERIRRWADRRLGVGFDQLLWLAPPTRAGCDAHYRIFNADGLEADQCGNGARCAGYFMQLKHLHTGDAHRLRFQMQRDQIEVEALGAGQFRVAMGQPNFSREAIPCLAPEQAETYAVTLADAVVECSLVSMGNPHAVVWVEDVATAEVARLGPLLQQHAWFPQQVNVGFAQKLSRQSIRLRVYERGAGETLACGTGACAAMVVGRQRQDLSAEVEVIQAGGACSVEWRGPDASVLLAGPAACVFEGVLSE